MISIAIDGPSGAGKSSLSRRLAAELGYIYVDTGAMYRTIGLHVLRSGADTEDEDAVAALLPGIRLEMRYVDGVQHMFLNGEDVSGLIRTEEVSMAASHVSAHPSVRLGPGALWCMTPPAPLWPKSTAWPAGRVRRAKPCWSQATKTIPRCRASLDTHGAVYLFLPIWRN